MYAGSHILCITDVLSLRVYHLDPITRVPLPRGSPCCAPTSRNAGAHLGHPRGNVRPFLSYYYKCSIQSNYEHTNTFPGLRSWSGIPLVPTTTVGNELHRTRRNAFPIVHFKSIRGSKHNSILTYRGRGRLLLAVVGPNGSPSSVQERVNKLSDIHFGHSHGDILGGSLKYGGRNRKAPQKTWKKGPI